MANNTSLNQLKQKYRTRYYGNRVQDIPDLKPGDNAVSFVHNYLNVTASNSDYEDCEESSVIRRPLSTQVESHLQIQQSREIEGQDLLTKSRVDDMPHCSQGAGHLMTKSDSPTTSNAFKTSSKKLEVSHDKLFSDDESDNEESHVVAKLIDESLSETDDIVGNKLLSNSKKPKEKLYSSDTSVVQEPPSPTSNIHAKKWLSFKESTFAANNNAFTTIVSRASEEFTNNTPQLRRQETLNSNKVNPNRADITYDLHPESADNGPEDEFVIEEESGCNLDAWISPFKKKKASVSTRAKEYNKPTPTPKITNSVEVSSSLKKKSENTKVSLIRSATTERPEDEFVVEEESGCDLDAWISPIKKKRASVSTRAKEDNKPTPTPKKANSVEASSNLPKTSENEKASLIKNGTPERIKNTEKKRNDLNAKKNFSNIFLKTATAGHIGNRLSSLVYDVPATSTAVNADEEDEFEIEDISDINKSNLLTIPVKAKATQISHVSKRENSAPDEVHPKKTENLESKNASMSSHTERNEYFHQEAVLPQESVVLQEPLSQGAVGSIEREESIHQDNLPVNNQEENDSHHKENASWNHVKQVQQLHQTRCSPRIKSDCSSKKSFDAFVENFSIRVRKGKSNAKSKVTAKKTKSKEPEEKQEEHPVKEKKTKKNAAEKKTKKSNKQEKSSKARNDIESAKDCMSNDLETEENQEALTAKRASRKRKHTDELVKVDMKKNVEATVCRQPHNESLQTNNSDEQQTVTDMGLQSKKRKAKMKNISTPCPADHNKEESVFKSGPVARQRTGLFAGSMKPLACDLNFPDVQSGGEEECVSTEDDEPVVSSGENLVAVGCIDGPKTNTQVSGKSVIVEHFIGGPKINAQISEEQEDLLKRYSIVFDPDTRSDALVECFAQSERSEFVGNDSCTYCNSFNNDIFTTGKMKIAPKKKSERRVFVSDIAIYYVEQGRVQVNLHKSERILKDGDFFFVPPGNSCTITNLQDNEAVLVFNFLQMLPLFKED